MRILIAEDELSIADNYKVILESRNHQVTLTEDGADCILAYDKAYHEMQAKDSKASKEDPFDLVVLDFRMPKKDGIDVAKHILTLHPKQKIIFATAYTEDALDGLFKKIQSSVEVLQKPFDLDTFALMVEDFGSKSLVQ